MKKALPIAAMLLALASNARAENEDAKKAETAEVVALSLLLQQAQAALAPANALDALRKDTAVSIAAIEALMKHSPAIADPTLYWPVVQNLDRPGLLAIAHAYQAATVAAATGTLGTDVWLVAAMWCANGLVSRLGG